MHRANFRRNTWRRMDDAGKRVSNVGTDEVTSERRDIDTLRLGVLAFEQVFDCATGLIVDHLDKSLMREKARRNALAVGTGWSSALTFSAVGTGRPLPASLHEGCDNISVEGPATTYGISGRTVCIR